MLVDAQFFSDTFYVFLRDILIGGIFQEWLKIEIVGIPLWVIYIIIPFAVFLIEELLF
ncbi:MAG: hypothetical protein II305_04360 [Clostridia bacterium]|nr:hypothetical protein [Clostridia bacterium]